MAALMGSPEMQRAIEGVASNVTRGALSDPETTALVKRLTAELTRVLAEVVRTELARAMSPEAQRAILRSVAEAGAAAARGASRAIAENADTLAPALGMAMATELQSPDIRDALRTTSREITRGVVLGTKDALAQDTGAPPPPLMVRMKRLVTLANIALGVAILAMIAIPIGLLILWQKRRREPVPVAAVPYRGSRLLRPTPDRGWAGARLRT